MEHKIHSYVYKTKEYDFFKQVFENRDVNQAHIKDLVNEINKVGQKIPIVVDVKGNIIDGNHRYLACKQLSIEILYIISEGNVLEDMQSINQNVNNWSIKQAVEHYAKRGYEHYVNTVKASQYSGVSVNFICEIASHRNNKVVRRGEFKSDRWDLVFEFLQYHKQFQPFIKASKTQGFINALFHIWLLKKVDKTRLLNKVIEYQDEFIRPLPKTLYTEKILTIYNQNLKSKDTKIKYIFNQKKEIEIREELKIDIAL